MKKLLYAALVAGATLVACSQQKEETSEWNLVWEENFDSTDINPAVWTRINRGSSDWNNTMTTADTCYSLVDGNMVLKGIASYEGDGDSVPYLTGGIFTKNKKGFGNGRLEIKAKLQGAQGAWPAIWMLPFNNEEWPKGGEIDIMERLNHDTIAYQTIHTYYTYVLGHGENPDKGSTGPINPNDYNIYAVEMYPDSLCFFINDYKTFTYPRLPELPDSVCQFPFNKPYYLLIDMQLGGEWVGAVDSTQVPVEMHVDWVKFYQKNNPAK